MAEYWEPIRDRGNDTNAVWNEFNASFTVGSLTLGTHTADVALFEGLVQARDDAEDEYDEAIDAKDGNLHTLAGLNTRAVSVIRGNLEAGDALMLELQDVSGMRNDGSGKIMARGRKLATLWKKVNAARAAGSPTLAPIEVGGAVVDAVDTALAANEPLLMAVSGKLSAWSSARSALRALSSKVDKNNKRWYEAWSGNYAPGSPEYDALSQIDTESGDAEPPGAVTFSVMYDGDNDEFHIDAEAEHATHFRVLRKGPGETDFIERASNAESPIHDPVTLPGVYEFKLQARNSTADGPVSAVQNGTVPG
jgi:hypothetical protein